jgi:hypothetical protein
MTISLSMVAGVLMPLIIVGGACSMAINIDQTSGVLSELTLPAPKGLRLASWLRPAL